MGDTRALYQVDDAVLEEFKNFRFKRKYRWVLFDIKEVNGEKTHSVDSVEADRSKRVEELLAALPESSCRYVVYEHEYKTADGRQADKLFFINWNPRAAATAAQMDYLTGRQKIRDVCDGCFDLSASTTKDIKAGILGDDGGGSDQDEVADDDDWLDE